MLREGRATRQAPCTSGVLVVRAGGKRALRPAEKNFKKKAKHTRIAAVSKIRARRMQQQHADGAHMPE